MNWSDSKIEMGLNRDLIYACAMLSLLVHVFSRTIIVICKSVLVIGLAFAVVAVFLGCEDGSGQSQLTEIDCDNLSY